MPGDAADAEQAKEQGAEAKPTRGMWRDRLKDKASKLTKNKNTQNELSQDVVDFLRSGSSTSVASASTASTLATTEPKLPQGPPRLDLPRIEPPRLDTGSQFLSSVVPEDRVEPLGFPALPISKKKRPKPPGIHVSFSNQEPDVIGEGGDECELPANQVIGSWVPPAQSAGTGGHPHHESPLQPPPPILQAGMDQTRRSSLQRAPTGLRVPSDSWAQKRLSMSMEEGLIHTKKEDAVPDLENREPTLPNVSLEPELRPQPIEEKSYVAAAHGEAPKTLPTSPTNGGEGVASNFLAYNPSLRQKSESPRKPPAPLISSPPPRQSSERQAVSSPSSHEETNRPSRKEAPQIRLPVLESPGKLFDARNTPESSPPAAVSSSPGDEQHVGISPPLPEAPIRQHDDGLAAELSPPGSSDASQSLGSATAALSASTDPSKSVYPHGATVAQSSHDNLLHQPKITENHSPFPSPVYDQYGEMPSIEDVTSKTPEVTAGEELYTRMKHMRGIFQLTAERIRPVNAISLGQWLRASVWWFLMGKMEMDGSVRSGPAHGSQNLGRGEDNLPINKQCYVDMAKAWWILQEIVPGIIQSHSGVMSNADIADGLSHEQLLEVLQRMKWEMGRYFLKLDGRGMLPPEELLVQGADPEIWLPYPSLPSGLYALTAGLNPRSLARQTPANPETAFNMPLNDSESVFNYRRFFGMANILGDASIADASLPCAVSVIRPRTQMLAEFLVTTQDGQINLHVQSDKRVGPAWSAVKWNAKANSMLVILMGEVAVEVRLHEADFRVLYGVHDYNHKLESERLPHPDEELLFGDVVRAFHFMGPKDVKTEFPPVPVPDCKVRLFQKHTTVNDGSGERKTFRGYRLSVTSPPTIKTLSNMSRQIPENRPIRFNNLRGENDAPALALVLEESQHPASLIFTFESSLKRAAFHTIMAGTATSPDECFSEDIPMHSFAVAGVSSAGTPASPPFPMPAGMQWQRLKVINLGENLDDAPCIFSDRLRVCMSSNFGSITDRINIGTGEQRIALDPNDTTAIRLFRPAQNNLTMSFIETTVRSKDVAHLSEVLTFAQENPSCRIYKFQSLPVLHDFETLVTGFAVLYDGQATQFSITRRRMFVSIHKHLETDHARIQILKEAQKTVLVAFFKNFATGKCMCFELKGTDHYESSTQGGKFLVRFVEAKFAMPKALTEDRHDMVCLDVLEYPNEHDDLVFGFDTEDDRDLFARALPASVSKASRMGFRR